MVVTERRKRGVERRQRERGEKGKAEEHSDPGELTPTASGGFIVAGGHWTRADASGHDKAVDQGVTDRLGVRAHPMSIPGDACVGSKRADSA